MPSSTCRLNRKLSNMGHDTYIKLCRSESDLHYTESSKPSVRHPCLLFKKHKVQHRSFQQRSNLLKTVKLIIQLEAFYQH